MAKTKAVETTIDPFKARVQSTRAAKQQWVRIGTDLKAKTKDFGDQLTEATKAINEHVPENDTDLPEDCLAWSKTLVELWSKRANIQAKKKAEIGKLKKRHKRAFSAWSELSSIDVTDKQIAIPLGDATLADGLGISPDSARVVYSELHYRQNEGVTLDADMKALKAHLEQQGCTAFTDADDDAASDADASEDDEDEDEDESAADAANESPALAAV
jgi:hypothetical protein